jgi:anaerobic selenocysteine-containing dehydrogenase
LNRTTYRAWRFWGTERLAQTPGLMAVELFDAIARGEVKAVWIMGTNPAVSLPDSHAVCQALASCPLVIVSEVMRDTDTSRFAHIQFPALGWGEKTALSPTLSGVSRASALSARARRSQTGLVDNRPGGKTAWLRRGVFLAASAGDFL